MIKKKNNKDILIVQLIVLIVLASSLVTATKPLPSNYGTFEYANKTIDYAEKSILSAEEKIKFIEEKGLESIVSPENYEVAKKGFETAVSRIPERKKSLETAKEYFNKGDYFNANKYAVSADAEVSALNNVLEDRVTPYGIRVQTVEEINKTEPKQPNAPLESTKEGVIGEVGPEKDRTIQPRAPLESTINALETIGGSTGQDCEEYLAVCKSGNKILCIKWGTNCRDKEEAAVGVITALETIGGATGQDCEEYLAECEAGNKILCVKWDTNCREIEEAAVGTKDEITFKDEKIYLNDKEVKIMPDTASQKAINILELKKDIEIELKNTGKPTYEIIGMKEVRLFGFIKTEMPIKTEVNGETGNIENTERPWWSFLAKE